MSKLAALSSGNFTSSIWGVISSMSTNITGSEAVGINFASTRSQAFTPGAVTISHIAVMLYNRVTSVGTFSVRLVDSATATEVTGTLATINVSDLPANAVGGTGGTAASWIMFKLAAPVTLAAATAYKIEAAVSSSGSVELARQTGTTDDIARFLVTTTTASPAAGDDFVVGREYTGTGTYNDIVVTMDNTTTTDFGSDSATNIYQSGLQISAGGLFQYGTSASTNYYLKLSGYILVMWDGEFRMGKIGSEIPRSSTATLELDSATSKRYGIQLNNGSTLNVAGQSRTAGKEVSWCLLNTDEAVNSTSLGVSEDTGWLDNDPILVTSTSNVITEVELGALNGNAGASTLTVDGFAGAGGGLAYSHLGTDPRQAEVALLVRNVVIKGTTATTTLGVYIFVVRQATVNLSWMHFQYFGSVTDLYRGIQIEGTSSAYPPSLTLSHVLFTDPFTSSLAVLLPSTNASQTSVVYSIDNVVVYATASVSAAGNISLNCALNSDSDLGAASLGLEISNCLLVGIRSSLALAVYYADSVSNIRVSCGSSGSSSEGIVRVAGDTRLVVDGLVIHSCTYNALDLDVSASNTIFQNCSFWHCTTYGVRIVSLCRNIRFDNCQIFGNTSGGLYLDSTINGVFSNCYFGASTSYSTSRSILMLGRAIGGGEGPGLTFYNCEVGTVSGVFSRPTSCLYFTGSNNYGRIRFIDCNFDYITNFIEPNTTFYRGYYTNWMLSFINSDGGSDIWSYIGNGILRRSTTVVRTGTYSMKIEPLVGYNKCVTPSFFMPVTSGNSLTPSVYVYEDGSYNGNRARLILKSNDAIGVANDTVLATATIASSGAWEQLTAATPLASQDGVMEFVIDCDGTAGGLYIDDFTI